MGFWDFRDRAPSGLRRPGKFGALPAIYGTLVTSAIAMVHRGPVGRRGRASRRRCMLPRRLRGPVAGIIDLLAAIPSVVYGLWGLLVLVPAVEAGARVDRASTTTGSARWRAGARRASLLLAGLVLAVMILPIITAVVREVLATVPVEQREAALALGATRWEMVRGSMLPWARSGIVGASALGLGRAVGETIAVAMMLGSQPTLFESLLGSGADAGRDDRVRVQRRRQLAPHLGAGGDGGRRVRRRARRSTSSRGCWWALGGRRWAGPAGARHVRTVRRKPGADRSLPSFARRGVRCPARPGCRPNRGPALLPVSRFRRMAFAGGRAHDRMASVAHRVRAARARARLRRHQGRGCALARTSSRTTASRTSSGNGIKHALVGTLIMIGVAAVVAVPLGVLTALFIRECRIARPAHAARRRDGSACLSTCCSACRPIVAGIIDLDRRGRRHGHVLGPRRGPRARVHHVPDRRALGGRDPAARTAGSGGGGAGARLTAVAHHVERGAPRCRARAC